jgi:hypothetical protein
MRKQYDYYETRSFKYDIILYHDGVKVAKESKWVDNLYERLKELEAQGYTRGYLKEDVDEARRKYEHKYENRIDEDKYV